jgi:hypothetical protein
MSKGNHLAALMIAGMVGTAFAGNNAGTPKSGSQAATQGSGARVSVAAQNPGTPETAPIESTPEAMKRKQARAARHDAIEKAQQHAMDSVEVVFSTQEAAEEAGTSAIVKEKIQADKDAKAGKGDANSSKGK